MLSHHHHRQTRSRHQFVPLALVAVVLAVALGAIAPRITAAAAGQPASIEGSWTLDFPSDEAAGQQLAAFFPGGIVVATNAPTFADESAAGGRVHSTDGLGAWRSLGNGRYAFRVVFLYFDAEEQPWGTVTVDGVVTLDATGDHFSGTFRVHATSVHGMILDTEEDEPIVGARILPPMAP